MPVFVCDPLVPAWRRKIEMQTHPLREEKEIAPSFCPYVRNSSCSPKRTRFARSQPHWPPSTSALSVARPHSSPQLNFPARDATVGWSSRSTINMLLQHHRISYCNNRLKQFETLWLCYCNNTESTVATMGWRSWNTMNIYIATTIIDNNSNIVMMKLIHLERIVATTKKNSWNIKLQRLKHQVDIITITLNNCWNTHANILQNI
jgi:hypothetical protein